MVHYDNTPFILIGGVWVIIFALAALYTYKRKDDRE